MNKKIFSTLTILVGVLALMGAGCSLKSPANKEVQIGMRNPTFDCSKAKEMATSNAQVKELKAIFKEAGCEVVLTEDTKLDSPTQGTLVFNWKNAPIPAELEAAFKKHGYKVEATDLFVTAQKGNTIVNVSLANDASCKTISVSIADKSLKTSNKPTIDDCASLFAMGPKIDMRINTLAESYPWTIKYYDMMAILEKKYGITQDQLSVACKTWAATAGFDAAVNKQKIKMGI